MEEIFIRHECSEGQRNPSLADVERALIDIEAGFRNIRIAELPQQ